MPRPVQSVPAGGGTRFMPRLVQSGPRGRPSGEPHQPEGPASSAISSRGDRGSREPCPLGRHWPRGQRVTSAVPP